MTKYKTAKLSFMVAVFFLNGMAVGDPIKKKNDKDKNNEKIINPSIMWCAKTDNNTHIGHCFKKQKDCKEFSYLRFEERGGKLHLCRPTRL